MLEIRLVVTPEGQVATESVKSQEKVPGAGNALFLPLGIGSVSVIDL